MPFNIYFGITYRTKTNHRMANTSLANTQFEIPYNQDLISLHIIKGTVIAANLMQILQRHLFTIVIKLVRKNFDYVLFNSPMLAMSYGEDYWILGRWNISKYWWIFTEFHCLPLTNIDELWLYSLFTIVYAHWKRRFARWKSIFRIVCVCHASYIDGETVRNIYI